MIAACNRCEMLTVVTPPGGLCFRCRPPSDDELARTWLPETHVLKLSAMDVGFLSGALYRVVKEHPESPVPAGVARLLGKLDQIAEDIYDLQVVAQAKADPGPPVPFDPERLLAGDAGGSSEPGGER